MNDYSTKDILRIVLLLILLGIGIFAYTHYKIGYAFVREKLADFKLIPIPETFTELYFEDHSSLPTHTVAGKTDSFSFTIHNIEYATTTYPYSVYFEYNLLLTKVLFEKDTVTLAPGEVKTITVSHTWKSGELQGKVVVLLESTNQYINFLLSH